MARFQSEAELKAFLGKLDPDYTHYALKLWQKGIRTPKQLVHFSEPHYLGCDVLEAHIDDIKARADGGGVVDAMGLEDLQELAAFARQHLKKSRSVRLSSLNPSKWGDITRNAGIIIQHRRVDVSGLELQAACPFQWSEASGPSQAKQYLHHISHHIQGAFDDKEYCMFDARRFTTLLTVTGMQAELGFKVRGTTDAALMSQQSIAVGTASNGFRWLWELKRELHNPMKGPATQEASSRSGKEDQEAVGNPQSNAACQAMAALFLANIHAPHLKPGITLTDLRDNHSIFWLDGLNIMYYAAPDAATAWALTKALLLCDPASEGCSDAPSTFQLPQGLEPLLKRQRLDVQGMRNSGGELAQLAALSGSIDSHELKLSTAACLLKQLFNVPAFYSEGRPPRPIPFGIYT